MRKRDCIIGNLKVNYRVYKQLDVHAKDSSDCEKLSLAVEIIVCLLMKISKHGTWSKHYGYFIILLKV